MTVSMKRWLVALVFTVAFAGCSSGDGDNYSDVMGQDSQADTWDEDLAEDSLPNDSSDDTVEQWTEFDPTTAAALQALLDEHVLFSADPGITLTVMMDDGRRWSGSSGIAALQTSLPMESDTGFRVGSNTKPIVAVVVLQLVEEGLVGLDDDITDYFPEYTQWEGISVRMLLGMRSGILDYLTNADFMLTTIQNPETEVPPEDVLAYVEEEPLQFAPGEDGQYNNSSYLLLGMIIEQVTGNTVEDEIQARIVEPLDLQTTFLDITGETRDEVARGYMDLNLVGILFGVPQAVLAFIPEENIYSGSVVDCSYLFHPSITWAAGALISSAEDMAVFMRELLTGGLLESNTLAEMEKTEEIMLLGSRIQYGLGLQVRPTAYGDVVGHGGLNFGYQAGTYYSEAAQATFSHMHNYLPEQSDGFQNDLLGLLINGVSEVPPVCVPAEGFFDPSEGPYLAARFKGTINPLDTEIPEGGVNEWHMYDGEEDIAVYGFGSNAEMTMSGLQPRMSVNSYAPANSDDYQMLAATINFDPNAFEDLDETGTYEVSMLNPGAALVTVAEVKTDEEFNPLQFCFIAVNDFARTSKFQICEPDGFVAEAGAELKLFANFALETDPEAVESTLSTLNLPRCICVDDEGAWGACQE